MSRVLTVGIYLADRPHAAGLLLYELASSAAHEVTQRWTALAPNGEGHCDLPCTVSIEVDPVPKFSLIDAMTQDAEDFDWVLVCDDDIEVRRTFSTIFWTWPSGSTSRCVSRQGLRIAMSTMTSSCR